MFTVNCEMDLFDFEQMVGFWSGAKDRWNSMNDGEREYLNDYIEGMEFTSLTQVNDFIWFESDEILEELDQDEEDED